VECCARPCSGGSDAGAKTGRWSAAAAFIAGGGEEGGGEWVWYGSCHAEGEEGARYVGTRSMGRGCPIVTQGQRRWVGVGWCHGAGEEREREEAGRWGQNGLNRFQI
jgi:hypothetical protein